MTRVDNTVFFHVDLKQNVKIPKRALQYVVKDAATHETIDSVVTHETIDSIDVEETGLNFAALAVKTIDSIDVEETAALAVSNNIYVEFVMRRSLGGFFRKQVIYRFKPEAEIDGDADNEKQHEDTGKDNPEAEQDGADVEQADGDAEKDRAENSANQTEEPAGEKGTIVDGIEAAGAHAPFVGEAGEVEAGDVKDPTANGNEGSAKRRECLKHSCMVRWNAAENSANQTEEPAGEKGTIVDGIEAAGAHAPFAGEAGEVEAGDAKDPTANGNEGYTKETFIGREAASQQASASEKRTELRIEKKIPSEDEEGINPYIHLFDIWFFIPHWSNHHVKKNWSQ